MNSQPAETNSENARIVARLRQRFESVALRLTPDIEPATIYPPVRQPAEKEPAR